MTFVAALFVAALQVPRPGGGEPLAERAVAELSAVRRGATPSVWLAAHADDAFLTFRRDSIRENHERWCGRARARSCSPVISTRRPPPRCIVSSATAARSSAITHYRKALALEQTSPEARWAWLEAWRLIAGLPPTTTHFFCVYD
ncbi:MAG TPA: hypothetical protein VGV12_10205 [Gemmatimonadales bacterium]|nr:hypothetical protein [Gemmatimonadales bacterium]